MNSFTPKRSSMFNKTAVLKLGLSKKNNDLDLARGPFQPPFETPEGPQTEGERELPTFAPPRNARTQAPELGQSSPPVAKPGRHLGMSQNRTPMGFGF